jgi:hypothetical protein
MSIFMDPDRPVHTVVMEADLTITVEEFTKDMVKPGHLTLFDIVEQKKKEDLKKVAERLSNRMRRRKKRERNMAILFFWDAMMLRKSVNPGGALMNKDPAPLNTDEIVTVFKQLANHPDYNDHTVIARPEKDDCVIELKSGEVMICDKN